MPTHDDYVKNGHMNVYVNDVTCPECHGTTTQMMKCLRLQYNGVNIYEFATMSIQKEMDICQIHCKLTDREKMIGEVRF